MGDDARVVQPVDPLHVGAFTAEPATHAGLLVGCWALGDD